MLGSLNQAGLTLDAPPANSRNGEGTIKIMTNNVATVIDEEGEGVLRACTSQKVYNEEPINRSLEKS